jgi:phage repressor protein C with HTH and peptisase S24 domain
MDTINKRIRYVRKEFCGDKNIKFAAMLGENANTVNNWVREGYNVGRGVASKISDCFNINTEWLLTGEGEMLNTVINKLEEDISYIPLLPISAQGGSLNDFVVSVKDADCEKIISPIKGAECAVTVSGDSMAPEYPAGSQVLIKRINEKAFIDWGKVYVLDTCNGTVIKILVPSEREGYVKCVSINPDEKYASFDVAFDDIYGIYRVLLCMSTK